jgi:hypothetical protein
MLPGGLTGATGVDVGGTLYDVEFVDGACAAVFSGCTSASFAFTTETSAAAAAQALLDQVFLDGVPGPFDSSPNLTRDCLSELACLVITPYDVVDEHVFHAFVTNFSPDRDDVVRAADASCPAISSQKISRTLASLRGHGGVLTLRRSPNPGRFRA